MAQYQDFSFEPPSRLEAVAQHVDEKEGNCHHRPGSCADSVMAATSADGVFGSDRSKEGHFGIAESKSKWSRVPKNRRNWTSIRSKGQRTFRNGASLHEPRLLSFPEPTRHSAAQ